MLRASSAAEYGEAAARLQAGRDALRPHLDGVLPLAAILGALWVLGLHDVLLGVGAVYLLLGGALAFGAAARAGEPTLPWRLYALAAAGGATALGLAALDPEPALWAGRAASIVLVLGLVAHVHRHAAWRRRTDLLLALRMAALLIGGTAALAMGYADGAHVAGLAASVLAVTGWVLAGAAVLERPAPTIADVRPGRAPDAARVPVA